MILVTGGLGFIGSHTARALGDLGAPCLATAHHARDREEAVRGGSVEVVALDVTDRDAVLALRDRYPITAIVHLGGALSDPCNELRTSSAALANILEAAASWGVRACIASAIGIYGGVDAAWREDATIPLLGAPHPIVAMKKVAEVYVELMAQRGVDAVALRIGAIYGPGYTRRRSFPTRLAECAARRRPLDLDGVWWGTAPGDAADWCYAKDCGRAIALLATAPRLAHHVYNVGSGVLTSNAELAAIVRRLHPDAPLGDYATGSTTIAASARPLDIARLVADTGFAPAFTAETALVDYITWLSDHPF
jgi:UDP-glucose 4-epimerase